MRFGLLQIGLGLSMLALGGLVGGIGWALAWPAASVLIVGLAYVARAPEVFGKRRETGSLSPWRAAALFPYHFVAWSLWQLKSRLSAERPHDEVAPGILVGRRPLGRHELPEGVRVVVDLTSELPRSPATLGVERYLCVPTLDTAAPADEVLAALTDALEREEGPVYFHCAMGHGRSATAAASLLIRRGLARDVEDAIATMKKVRPGVHLHAAQREAVRRISP